MKYSSRHAVNICSFTTSIILLFKLTVVKLSLNSSYSGSIRTTNKLLLSSTLPPPFQICSYPILFWKRMGFIPHLKPLHIHTFTLTSIM